VTGGRYRPEKAIRGGSHDAFLEAARALECDESEERFDAALRKVAAHKPPKENRESEKSKTAK
jgi:hypothetical protein